MIEIGIDGMCKCDCGTECPLGKMGMEVKCKQTELDTAGVKYTPNLILHALTFLKTLKAKMNKRKFLNGIFSKLADTEVKNQYRKELKMLTDEQLELLP